MIEVTRPDVVEILKTLGVQPRDGLLVHSALQFLGKPQGGVGIYLDAIQDVIGSEGTLAAPAFNFSFAKGEDYDPETAPAVGMGTFSEFVRQHPQARRTTHPMQSLAVIGKYAEELAGLDTPGAFDDGSAFDRMLQLDFKLLLLGADIQAVAMIHYSEQRAEVPYRCWKDFTGRIKRGDEWAEATYRMFVRDMEIDARMEIYPIKDRMESQSQWQQEKLGYGAIIFCSLADFAAAADSLFAEDPWVFVTNKPETL